MSREASFVKGWLQSHEDFTDSFVIEWMMSRPNLIRAVNSTASGNNQSCPIEQPVEILAEEEDTTHSKENVQQLLQNGTHHFTDDALQTAIDYFEECGVSQHFCINEKTLLNWLSVVKEKSSNDSLKHVLAVAQTVVSVISSGSLSLRLTHNEKLAMLVTALCHMLSDGCEKMTKSSEKATDTTEPLINLYFPSGKEGTRLENFISTLWHQECNIFEEVSPTDLPEIMEMICAMMMDYSASKALQKIDVMHDIVQTGQFSWQNSEHKALFRSMTLISCGLAVLANPWHVHERKSKAVVEGMLLSDNKECTAKLQMDIINTVIPLLNDLVLLDEAFKDLWIGALSNYEKCMVICKQNHRDLSSIQDSSLITYNTESIPAKKLSEMCYDHLYLFMDYTHCTKRRQSLGISPALLDFLAQSDSLTLCLTTSGRGVIRFSPVIHDIGVTGPVNIASFGALQHQGDLVSASGHVKYSINNIEVDESACEHDELYHQQQSKTTILKHNRVLHDNLKKGVHRMMPMSARSLVNWRQTLDVSPEVLDALSSGSPNFSLTANEVAMVKLTAIIHGLSQKNKAMTAGPVGLGVASVTGLQHYADSIPASGHSICDFHSTEVDEFAHELHQQQHSKTDQLSNNALPISLNVQDSEPMPARSLVNWRQTLDVSPEVLDALSSGSPNFSLTANEVAVVKLTAIIHGLSQKNKAMTAGPALACISSVGALQYHGDSVSASDPGQSMHPILNYQQQLSKTEQLPYNSIPVSLNTQAPESMLVWKLSELCYDHLYLSMDYARCNKSGHTLDISAALPDAFSLSDSLTFCLTISGTGMIKISPVIHGIGVTEPVNIAYDGALQHHGDSVFARGHSVMHPILNIEVDESRSDHEHDEHHLQQHLKTEKLPNNAQPDLTQTSGNTEICTADPQEEHENGEYSDKQQHTEETAEICCRSESVTTEIDDSEHAKYTDDVKDGHKCDDGDCNTLKQVQPSETKLSPLSSKAEEAAHAQSTEVDESAHNNSNVGECDELQHLDSDQASNNADPHTQVSKDTEVNASAHQKKRKGKWKRFKKVLRKLFKVKKHKS